MVSYAVMLDVPSELVLFVSGLLAARRQGDIRRLGAGFGLPQSTAYRYLEEVTGVLAARSMIPARRCVA